MSRLPFKWVPGAARLRESAVAWSFFSMGLRVGAGILVLPLMAHELPPRELGLWYVFISIGLLVGLVDLGFSYTVSRAAGYLWAGSDRLLPFGLAPAPVVAEGGRRPNLALMGALVATMRIYYRGLAAVVFLLMVGGGGVWIWFKTEGMEGAGSLRGAWLGYALGSVINLTAALWPALLAGVNGVRQGQQIIVVSQLLNYGLMAVGLSCHWGLWAMVAGNVAAGWAARELGRAAFLRVTGPGLRLEAHHWQPDLVRTLWPAAWRLGLMSVGSFLILQSSTLVCSEILGLETTASYGLSVQLITMLAGFSGVWVQVKMPSIHQLRAQGREAEIAPVFAVRMRWSVLTYVVGAAAIYGLAPWGLELIHARTPLLAAPWLLTLLAVRFLEMHQVLCGGLILSENQNPMVKPMLISGVVIVLLSLGLTPLWGMWGLLLSAGLVQAAFNNWWTVGRALRGVGTTGRHYWGLFFGSLPRAGRAA